MLQMARVRNDLKFNKLMGSIIEVLKGVASAEYFRLQAKRKRFDEFEGYLKDTFQMVDVGDLRHPFLGDPSSPKNIVLITSDAGFLGKLNMSIVYYALNQYNQTDSLTVVGRQGARYLEELGEKFTAFPGIDDDISYSAVVKLRDHIVNSFLDDKLGGAIIIYPHFISFAQQKTQTFQLLPCRFLFPQQSQRPIAQRQFLDELINPQEEIVIEPSLNRVVDYLVKIWVGQIIHLIFWESKLSEWAARVMHLENSSNEIRRQDRRLRLEYFRLQHRISDKNTREILSSICRRRFTILSKQRPLMARELCLR